MWYKAKFDETDFSIVWDLYFYAELLIADISFFENIFFYWPPASWESFEDMQEDAEAAAEEEEEEGLGLFKDYCNYQGWFAELFKLKITFGFPMYECEGGVYDMLVDSGKFDCGMSSATDTAIDELFEFEINPLHRFIGGRYDMDWNINTCEDYKDRIQSRDLEVRSLKDMLKAVAEEDGEVEVALNSEDYW